MKLLVKKLRPEARLPAFAHDDDSGMDLCACEDRTLAPGERAAIPLGVAFAPPPGTEIQLRARSGLALRSGIAMVNAPGTVDEGYRGEVGVILANFGDAAFSVKKGDRIAQIVVAPVTRVDIVETGELGGTERGGGGFGSTGV